MNDRELNDLRKYLRTEDDRERANRQAEVAKQSAMRKASLAYGASGSYTCPKCARGQDHEVCQERPVNRLFPEHEATTWAPLPSCVGCEDSLTCDNRSGIQGLCIVCLARNNAKAASHQAAHQSHADKQATKAGRSAMWIIPALAVILVLAWVLGRAGAALFFWLGSCFA